MVTGQRRGEIAGMRWDELHLESGYWEIRGTRTKNGKNHVVPLSFLAKEIISETAPPAAGRYVHNGLAVCLRCSSNAAQGA